MVMVAEASVRDAERLEELIAEQEAIFLRRQPRSAEMMRRAVGSLAGGVTSSWQISRPQPIWISHGIGSHVWDVDGNELVDLHNGYGVMAVGHGHPAVVRAVTERISRGSHFAQPSEDAIVVAENLSRRFGLPLWRYNNSGTEATMDAVHIMRAFTGRSKIVKVEGTYHGHHDSVQVSVYQLLPELGPASRPNSVPAASGIPNEIVQLTQVVPFNDLHALEGVFEDNEGQIAGMIMEAVMMNAGIIPPEPGYLEGVREITRRHGALLAFDEVKTGLTIGPGGATKHFGVTPDLVALAKALGGGLPCGAIGGSAEVMQIVADGGYEQCGTFNGNPLTMASARAALTEVLTDEGYARFDRLRAIMVDGCRDIIEEFEIPAYVEAFGAKGCIVFSPTRIRNYRDYLSIDDRFSQCLWLFQHNGGVFMPPWGKAEQWMLSVQHGPEDAERFVENVRSFAKALRA